MKKIFLLLMSGLLFTSMSASALNIVKNGKAASVVVVPDNMTELQSDAVRDFVHRVEVSTGVVLDVVKSSNRGDVKSKYTQIVIGEPCPDGAELLEEQYRIVAYDGDIYICGEDRPNNLECHTSRVTTWALSHIMEEYMGVQWIWPGELGTITPKMKSIELPDDIDYSFQPKLVRRRFGMIGNKNLPVGEWCARYQMTGRRESHQFHHSFREGGNNGNWFKDFSETRPELLAKDPNGKPGWLWDEEFFKLCVSNPDVVDEVIRRWKAAGSPDYWDMTSNDGSAYCTCDNCRALDVKYGGKECSKEDIWRGETDVNVSGRYVWFWNQVVTAMRKTNPKAQIGVFLYSNYLYPPKNLKVADGIVGELVSGYYFQNWKDWIDAGVSSIALRPNWWCGGACAPNVSRHKQGYYIEQARKYNLHHVFMDSILEFWSTQGFSYYLAARLLSDYDVDTEDVFTDYCDAFAGASDEIRDYMNFWEDYHANVVQYTVPIGGYESQGPFGLFESYSRNRWGYVIDPLWGHWVGMPYMYPDYIMAEARELLDKATAAAGDDELTAKRVDYLREGLVVMELASDYMELYHFTDKPECLKRLQVLSDYTKGLQEKFDYWGGTEIKIMDIWGMIEEKRATW